MGRLKANIVKGVITSIIGTILMVLSLLLWFAGMINMMWEGAIGIILGCVLLLAPRSLERNIGNFLTAWGGKGGSTEESSTKPDVPDEDK